MSPDEIAAKLAVLEVFTMTAFGLYLANARNDPDYTKAAALLDHTRVAVSSLSQRRNMRIIFFPCWRKIFGA